MLYKQQCDQIFEGERKKNFFYPCNIMRNAINGQKLIDPPPKAHLDDINDSDFYKRACVTYQRRVQQVELGPLYAEPNSIVDDEMSPSVRNALHQMDKPYSGDPKHNFIQVKTCLTAEHRAVLQMQSQARVVDFKADIELSYVAYPKNTSFELKNTGGVEGSFSDLQKYVAEQFKADQGNADKAVYFCYPKKEFLFQFNARAHQGIFYLVCAQPEHSEEINNWWYTLLDDKTDSYMQTRRVFYQKMGQAYEKALSKNESIRGQLENNKRAILFRRPVLEFEKFMIQVIGGKIPADEFGLWVTRPEEIIYVVDYFDLDDPLSSERYSHTCASLVYNLEETEGVRQVEKFMVESNQVTQLELKKNTISFCALSYFYDLFRLALRDKTRVRHADKILKILPPSFSSYVRDIHFNNFEFVNQRIHRAVEIKPTFFDHTEDPAAFQQIHYLQGHKDFQINNQLEIYEGVDKVAVPKRKQKFQQLVEVKDGYHLAQHMEYELEKEKEETRGKANLMKVTEANLSQLEHQYDPVSEHVIPIDRVSQVPSQKIDNSSEIRRIEGIDFSMSNSARSSVKKGAFTYNVSEGMAELSLQEKPMSRAKEDEVSRPKSIEIKEAEENKEAAPPQDPNHPFPASKQSASKHTEKRPTKIEIEPYYQRELRMREEKPPSPYRAYFDLTNWEIPQHSKDENGQLIKYYSKEQITRLRQEQSQRSANWFRFPIPAKGELRWPEYYLMSPQPVESSFEVSSNDDLDESDKTYYPPADPKEYKYTIRDWSNPPLEHWVKHSQGWNQRGEFVIKYYWNPRMTEVWPLHMSGMSVEVDTNQGKEEITLGDFWHNTRPFTRGATSDIRTAENTDVSRQIAQNFKDKGGQLKWLKKGVKIKVLKNQFHNPFGEKTNLILEFHNKDIYNGEVEPDLDLIKSLEGEVQSDVEVDLGYDYDPVEDNPAEPIESEAYVEEEDSGAESFTPSEVPSNFVNDLSAHYYSSSDQQSAQVSASRSPSIIPYEPPAAETSSNRSSIAPVPVLTYSQRSSQSIPPASTPASVNDGQPDYSALAPPPEPSLRSSTPSQARSIRPNSEVPSRVPSNMSSQVKSKRRVTKVIQNTEKELYANMQKMLDTDECKYTQRQFNLLKAENDYQKIEEVLIPQMEAFVRRSKGVYVAFKLYPWFEREALEKKPMDLNTSIVTLCTNKKAPYVSIADRVITGPAGTAIGYLQSSDINMHPHMANNHVLIQNVQQGKIRQEIAHRHLAHKNPEAYINHIEKLETPNRSKKRRRTDMSGGDPEEQFTEDQLTLMKRIKKFMLLQSEYSNNEPPPEFKEKKGLLYKYLEFIDALSVKIRADIETDDSFGFFRNIDPKANIELMNVNGLTRLCKPGSRKSAYHYTALKVIVKPVSPNNMAPFSDFTYVNRSPLTVRLTISISFKP